MVTILIMSTAIISVIAGIAVAGNSSDAQKKQVGAVVVLRDFAEATMNDTYKGCSTGSYPSNYVPPGYTIPAGYNVKVTSVACYDGTSNPANFSGTTDGGGARLSLEATTADGRAKQTLEIVKVADYARPS
jgi:hypothetical protein